MVKSFARGSCLRRVGAAALAGVMALSVLAVSVPQAEARDGRNGALAAGAAVGLAAGALLGAAAANSGPEYIGPPPAYYPPPPPYPQYGGPVYYAPPPVPRCYMSPIQRWDPYIGQYVVVGHQQMCN